MDMLAQRKCTGRLTGALLVNGAPPTAEFVRMCAYVPQYDNFVPVMTTLETMQFYAGIILPRTWPAARRDARVSEVLQEMGLAHTQRTLVGGQSPGGLLIRGLRWEAHGGGGWGPGPGRGGRESAAAGRGRGGACQTQRHAPGRAPCHRAPPDRAPAWPPPFPAHSAAASASACRSRRASSRRRA
jgi:hypothetical protein